MKEYINIIDPQFDLHIVNQVGNSTGTYTLHLFEYKKIKPITRAFGIDDEGILYIGRTTKQTLLVRVQSLKKAITNNYKYDQQLPKIVGHKALSQKFYRIRKRINLADLFVRVYILTETPEIDESKMLERYVLQFGELPPLNGNYGSHVNWQWYH